MAHYATDCENCPICRMNAPALPYPTSARVHVFHDDGLWPDRWFMRGTETINRLHHATYFLPTDDEGDVCMGVRQWSEYAEKLLADHPGCVFVYV